MFDNMMLGAIVIIAIVVIGAAVVYSFTKKKKDYHSNGVPKQINDKDEVEGSSKKED